MKPIELASYCLLASAFILGGLLLSRVQGALEQKAQADMVVSRENFTVMTARTRQNEEAVFVLNNITSRLLIYRMNVARNELELVANEDMARQFSLPRGGGGTGRPGGRTPR